jgi:hypothetical protein
MAISNNQIPVAAFLYYCPARDGRIDAIDEASRTASLPLRLLPDARRPYRDPQFAELIHVIDPPRPSLVSR